MPGFWLALGPATFSVSTLFCFSQQSRVTVSRVSSRSITMCGRLWATAKSRVRRVPPRNGPRHKMSVASESMTFFSVLTEYLADSVSVSWYLSGIFPSSARRPAGHHPPCGICNEIATSRAARSTPVWPPETIFLGLIRLPLCLLWRLSDGSKFFGAICDRQTLGYAVWLFLGRHRPAV